MTMRSGFHNSIQGDRKYNAEDLNRPYKDIVSNGVFPNPSDQLQVFASSGMKLSVSAGGGLFGNGWVHNDAPVFLTIEASEATLNRIDAVVVHRDDSEQVRDTTLIIKKGVPATNPVPPSMTHNEYIDEYCLATIMIIPGTTGITQSMITDTRPDTGVCGWVTGLIDQVDTSTLFKQWESAYWQQYDKFLDEFQVWWKGIRDILNNDQTASAEILLLKQEKADRKKHTATLTNNGWELKEGFYWQTIEVPDMKSNDTVFVAPDPLSYDDYCSAGVVCMTQKAGQLTFRATIQISVKVNIINIGT